MSHLLIIVIIFSSSSNPNLIKNIICFLLDRGVLKLTDFGFAKETFTRDTLQTPCYTPYYVGKASSKKIFF